LPFIRNPVLWQLTHAGGVIAGILTSNELPATNSETGYFISIAADAEPDRAESTMTKHGELHPRWV